MSSLNLYNIWQTLIKEDVSPNDVVDAINNQYRVLVNYDDDKFHHTKTRMIEPYAYGQTKSGNPCIRCFQYSGDSHSGAPKWKLMRLDRILRWEAQPNNHFVAQPNRVGVNAPNYNENGDDSMSVVFNQVSFGDNQHDDDSSLSTLEKIRQQRQRFNTSEPVNIFKMNQNRGSVNTDSLNSQLNGGQVSRNNDTDAIPAASDIQVQRGAEDVQAPAVSDAIYSRDSRNSQQKRDASVMRKRDRRAQKRVDSMPTWRKDSLNQELMDIDGEK